LQWGIIFKCVKGGGWATASDERGTSSKCPRCGSSRAIKRGRLFRCKECRLEAHRDAVGAVNISLVWQGRTMEPTVRGSNNWVMAHPEVVFGAFQNNLEGTSRALA